MLSVACFLAVLLCRLAVVKADLIGRAPWWRPANTRKGPGCSPAVRAGYANNWPQGLDYGVYWLGRGSQFEKATGFKSTHYDPKKPTSIFFHGWQGAFGGTTKMCFRLGTRCKSCKDHVEIMDAWFDKGWNVGMFYWDQFADEKCVRDAEYKIWQGGDQPLRWVSFDSHGLFNYRGYEEHHPYAGTEHNVAELCAKNVQEALFLQEGSEVRFIGESLGTQLAARCLELVHDGGNTFHKAVPRLVLLEPAFSHVGLPGLLQCERVANTHHFGEIAERRTNDALKKLMDVGIPVELYTTSPFVWTAIVCASPHVYHDVHVQYHPRWCRFPLVRYVEMDFQNNIACLHDSAVSLYYLSMGREPSTPVDSGKLYKDYSEARDRIQITDESVSENCRVPSAATSYEEIVKTKTLCRSRDYSPNYIQTEGLGTLNVSDDVFRIQFKTPKMSQADSSIVNETLVNSLMEHTRMQANVSARKEPSDKLWIYTAGGIGLAVCLSGVGIAILSILMIRIWRKKLNKGVSREVSIADLDEEFNSRRTIGDSDEDAESFE